MPVTSNELIAILVIDTEESNENQAKTKNIALRYT